MVARIVNRHGQPMQPDKPVNLPPHIQLRASLVSLAQSLETLMESGGLLDLSALPMLRAAVQGLRMMVSEASAHDQGRRPCPLCMGRATLRIKIDERWGTVVAQRDRHAFILFDGSWQVEVLGMINVPRGTST